LKKIGIIIQARCNSKRFPNKILKKINNKETILEFQINRLLKSFQKENIIVATTKKSQKIFEIIKKKKLSLFVGSENNVIKRYLDASKKFNLDIVVRLTSDCPLIDPRIIKNMLNYFKKKNIDYLSNTLPPSKSRWPDGSDVEIFTVKSLKKANKISVKRSDKEHVTNLLWEQKIFKSKNFYKKKNLSMYKYSLDYKSELNLLKVIVKVLRGKKIIGSADQICKIISKNSKLLKIMKKNMFLYVKNRTDLYK
jgi:spore coat polysaccharide biosynthesis protein SpsF